uniref:Uncharacterized protein n=1 Tax=Arundo donax TaxID=35708 RepID=A0A0A9D599_ARUDO
MVQLQICNHRGANNLTRICSHILNSLSTQPTRPLEIRHTNSSFVIVGLLQHKLNWCILWASYSFNHEKYIINGASS